MIIYFSIINPLFSCSWIRNICLSKGLRDILLDFIVEALWNYCSYLDMGPISDYLVLAWDRERGPLFSIWIFIWSSTIIWKDYFFPIEIPWHPCVGLFLDSLFCFSSPFISSNSFTDYCSVLKSRSMVQLAWSFFLALAFLDLLRSSIHLRMSFSISITRKGCCYFCWKDIQILVDLKRLNILL